MSERPLVLVADDDPDILNLVTLRLERDDYEVIGAAEGARGVEAGADDYVKKPFSTTDLRSRVQAALGR